MPKRTSDYDTWLLNELTDARAAASYVNAAISESPDLLPAVLRDVAKAHRMARVAEEAGIARESLYTGLSESGNPTLNNLNAVLKAVGLRIAVVPDSEEFTVETSAQQLSGISFVSQNQTTELRNLFRSQPINGFSPSGLLEEATVRHYGL